MLPLNFELVQNEAVCSAVNHADRTPGTWWYLEATYHFAVRCSHIPGVHNRIPDALSRYHMSSAHQDKIVSMAAGLALTKSVVSKNDFVFEG